MSSKARKPAGTAFKIVFLSLLAVLLVAFDYYLLDTHISEQKAKIIHEATIECLDPITLDLFFTEVFPETYFVTDVNSIDTSIPASYDLTICIWKFDVTVRLNIVDTRCPVGVAIPQYTYTNWLPDVRECIVDEYDLHNVTIAYQEGTPDISHGGEKLVPVTLTDDYGNETIINVPFYVTDDHVAPLIYGPHDLQFYIGDPVTYREGIRVYDNYDRTPTLTIDTSDIDPFNPGVYPLRYIATDEYGNSRTTTVMVTFEEKPEGFVPEEEVYALADDVLAQILEPGMNDYEKVLQIYYWCRNNVHYTGDSIKTHWTAGAYEGFTTHQGDCYTYYACCKVLLDRAGIPNMMVTRNPAWNSMHFWNLVCVDGLWYHCDATPSSSHDDFWVFRTDAELDGSHRFDPEIDGLPDRATESIQRYINIYTRTYNPPEPVVTEEAQEVNSPSPSEHKVISIRGTHDIQVEVGATILYRSGVTVTSTESSNTRLTVDSTHVNPRVPGEYPVTYTGSDDRGNSESVVITVTVVERDEQKVLENDMRSLASSIVVGITNSGMNDYEKVIAIFNWARYNIGYSGISDKSNWMAAAYDGLRTRRGDCYTYYACCRALLDACNISNMMVERGLNLAPSVHYWNLVCVDGQWYHCDACPTSVHEGYIVFMTDFELTDNYIFDPIAGGLPDRATTSIQYRIDYSNNTYNPSAVPPEGGEG